MPEQRNHQRQDTGPAWSSFSKFIVVIVLLPVCLVIVAVSFLIIVPYLDQTRQYWSPIPFDSKQWKSAGANAPDSRAYTAAARQRMLLDLVNRCQLIGKTETEVRELLGSPTHGVLPELWYDVAPFGLDTLYLKLFFKNGKVQSYQLHST